MNSNEAMRRAIDLARQKMRTGMGRPFGCVILLDGRIVGEGWNSMDRDHDPTAHGEIMAIRDACRRLKTLDLTGSELYTSCEPCPMCLGAIYWARPDKVYYGSTQTDAANIGFDDAFIYKEIPLPYSERSIPFEQLAPEIAIKAFNQWTEKEDRREY